MTQADSPSDPHDHQSRFRKTLIQVLMVQVVALTLLGLIQIAYHV